MCAINCSGGCKECSPEDHEGPDSVAQVIAEIREELKDTHCFDIAAERVSAWADRLAAIERARIDRTPRPCPTPRSAERGRIRQWFCRHRNALMRRDAGRMWMECPDCGHQSEGISVSAQGGAE